MRPSGGWSLKGTPAIVEIPSTKEVSYTILGAISAKFVVSMELRKIDFSNRKRKAADSTKKPTRKGTITGHYLNFLEKTMDEMYCFPELKYQYIMMDNTPIHTTKEIEVLILKRGYRCVYLPLYSPEFNPIEQLWSIVENKVKRSQFKDTIYLTTRISEACNSVPPKHLRVFIQHSVDVFQKCLNSEPI
jgi:hypothetical protein